MAAKVCAQCGRTFEDRTSTQDRRFCVRACSRLWHRAHSPDISEQYIAAGASATAWRPWAQLYLADRVQQWLNYWDAANECEHGWLPHETDRHERDGCVCWKAKTGEVVPLKRPARKKSAKKRRAA